MAPTATIVSARVDHDVAAWASALVALGHTVRALGPDEIDEIDDLATGADPVDVLVVHDPVRLGADAVRRAAAHHIAHPGRRVVVRHRDLSHQRRDLPTVDLSDLLVRPDVHHVTASLHARRELEAAGARIVHCLPDVVDLDPVPGDRDATRAALGFAPDAIVLLQPTVAAARKNVAGAVRYVNELATVVRNRPLHLWVKGPVADDHRAVFDKLVERCTVPVTVGEAPSAADAYAAADVVVFPPAWDCFGDVVLEAIAHRRACVTSDYPVLAELVAGGLRVLPIDDPSALLKFLGRPESARRTHLDATARRARVSYSAADLPIRLASLVAGAER